MSEAFIVDGVRTPIGRYGGALAHVRPDDLAAHVIKELGKRFPAIGGDRIDEVVLGCANQAGEDNRNVARMAALLAGLPVSVPGTTVNRLCGSGLDAVGYAARMIRAGEADLVIAGGVESMSRAPLVQAKAEAPFQRGVEIHDTTIGWRFVNPRMQGAIRHRLHAGDGGERRRGLRHRARRSGRLRAAQPGRAPPRRRRTAGWRGRSSPSRSSSGKDVQLVERDEHPRATTLEKLAACRRCSGRTARSPPATPRASTTARPRCSSPRRARSRSMA